MGLFEGAMAARAPERRAITEWGTSAIPGPLGDMAGGGTFASIDLRRAEAALQKVAVWAAIDLIAGVASQLPLQTFRMQPDGTGALIPNSRLVQDPGGDDQGVGDWVYQYLGSKLGRGNAYGALGSFDTGTLYPTQIVLWHPDDVHGWRDRDGAVHWRVNGREVPAKTVWHRRAYPVAGQLLGLSPIGQHATVIGQGIAAARFGMQFFTDGAHPTVALQNSEEEIDQTKAVAVKSRLMSTVWGSREPLVMGRGWDFKQLSISPNESQFLETQKYTAAECARIFGPCVAEILGYETGGSMTYANQEQRALDFLKFTLNRWLRDVEAVFTRYLPKPQYVRFDRKVLLETDLMTRYNAHRTARDIGLSNIDEIRVMEDLAPLPNGQGEDYTPLLVQVAASRGIDAAQVKTGEPPADQPSTGQRAAADADPKDGEIRAWDPGKHPHGEHGHWASVAASVGDVLGIKGKVALGPGEKFVGSDKVGNVKLAWIDHNGSPRLRFGTPNLTRTWRGANKGATVNLDEHQIKALHSELSQMDRAGKDAAAEFKQLVKKFDAIEGTHGSNPAKMPPDVATTYRDLQEQYDLVTGQDEPYKRGAIHGDWGQVQFGVSADESGRGFQTYIAVKPTGAPDGWDLKREAVEGNGDELSRTQLTALIKRLDVTPKGAAGG